MVDRDEEVGRQVVRPGDALGKPGEAPPGGDEENALRKAGGGKVLVDRLREPKVEGVFGHAAGADRARHLGRVPDVDDDAERRRIALRGRADARHRQRRAGEEADDGEERAKHGRERFSGARVARSIYAPSASIGRRAEEICG